MEEDLVHPWGPRQLLRHPDELVLVLKCLEYDYRIQFPQEITHSEMSAFDQLWSETNRPTIFSQLRDFQSLPPEEQETLQTLVDNAVSHQWVPSHNGQQTLCHSGSKNLRLSEDDKHLLWSNRNYLHQFPRALPLVLASSFAWGPYSLSNVYVLLDKWAKLSPATAVELLLP